MFRFKRLGKSFQYALRGLVKTFHEEQNLQVQVIVGLTVLIFGFLARLERWEWIFLVFSIGLVILMEMINSAVERVSDVLKPRINDYIKEIKDIMAAGVMLASLLAIVVGLVIFWPHLFGK